jgi:ATP-dependent Lon protease
LPRHNEKDLIDIPPEVKADLTLRLVDTLDDVVSRLFEARPRATRAHPRALDEPSSRLPAAKPVNRKKDRPLLDPKTPRRPGTP